MSLSLLVLSLNVFPSQRWYGKNCEEEFSVKVTYVRNNVELPGFHNIDQLFDSGEMNMKWDSINLLTSFHENFCLRGREWHVKWLMIHMDDCSVHTSPAIEWFMSDHHIIRMSHPPCSQNMASSDFYLFVWVKNRLDEVPTSAADNSLVPWCEMLLSISVPELELTFTSWTDRVRQVSENNEDYIR
jgi:hypothetical protein